MSDNTFLQAETDPMRVDPRFRLDFPSKMNDGRQLSDYRSICLTNLMEKNMTTYQYRLFLKHNAEEIMNNYGNVNSFISNPNWNPDKCTTCSDGMVASAFLPVTCSGEQCITDINPNAGVGDYFVDNH